MGGHEDISQGIYHTVQNTYRSLNALDFTNNILSNLSDIFGLPSHSCVSSLEPHKSLTLYSQMTRSMLYGCCELGMCRVHCRSRVACFSVFPSLQLGSKEEEESDRQRDGVQRSP